MRLGTLLSTTNQYLEFFNTEPIHMIPYCIVVIELVTKNLVSQEGTKPFESLLRYWLCVLPPIITVVGVSLLSLIRSLYASRYTRDGEF